MHVENPSWQTFFAAWELFRDPVVCAGAAGVALGYLGVYVVLRRMVFVSAAVTQSAGLGVALAFYAEIHLGLAVDPLLGAAVLSLAVAALLSADVTRLRLPQEALLGLVFALSGGGAVLVGDRIAQEAHDIQSILFGSAVLVRATDLKAVLLTGAAVLALQVWFHRGLTFAVFDRDAAAVQGLPARLLNGLVLVSIAAVSGVASRALGSLPVFALAVLPATAVLLSGAPLQWAFPLAAAVGCFAGVAGYAAAYFLEFPVGASQTAVAGTLALLALGGRVAAHLLRAGRVQLHR